MKPDSLSKQRRILEQEAAQKIEQLSSAFIGSAKLSAKFEDKFVLQVLMLAMKVRVIDEELAKSQGAKI